MIARRGSGRRARATTARVTAAAGLALAAAVACTDIPTDANAVLSLEAGELPYPAVVAGDTLRDESGAPAPLRATAYNASGAPVPDATILFFTPDEAVTVEDGIVVAGGEPGRTVRLYARAGALTIQLAMDSPLRVVPEPVQLATTGEVPDSVSYDAPVIRSEPISAILTGAPVGDDASPAVPGWLVRYAIEFRGTVLAADDPRFRLVAPGGSGAVPAPVDTTDATGTVAREVVVLDTSEIAEGDSLVVLITTSHRGAPVGGSPLQVPLRLTAR